LSPEKLEAAFMESQYFKLMQEEGAEYRRTIEAEANRDQENFRNAALRAGESGVSKTSPYTLGFLVSGEGVDCSAVLLASSGPLHSRHVVRNHFGEWFKPAFTYA
jgi:hypothetical protein